MSRPLVRSIQCLPPENELSSGKQMEGGVQWEADGGRSARRKQARISPGCFAAKDEKSYAFP